MPSCPYCQSTAQPRKDGFYNGLQRYRCRDCGRKYTAMSVNRAQPGQPTVPKPCAFCGELTTNPQFCSKSCAASYNNAHFPKRQRKVRHCRHCGIIISRGRTVCDDCNPSSVDWSQRTLGSLQEGARYQVSAKVRDLARYNYDKANLPRACANCGYDKHVEICHIHAINRFPDDTPIAKINALSNLIALCPNCHWEFDNGLLEIEPLALGNSPEDR